MDNSQISNGVLLVLRTQEPGANLINNNQYGRESSNIALSIHFCKPLRSHVGLHVLDRTVCFMLLFLLPDVIVAVTVGCLNTNVGLYRTWGSAVSVVTMLRTGQYRFRIQAPAREFFSRLKRRDLLWGPTAFYQMGTGAISRGEATAA